MTIKCMLTVWTCCAIVLCVWPEPQEASDFTPTGTLKRQAKEENHESHANNEDGVYHMKRSHTVQLILVEAEDLEEKRSFERSLSNSSMELWTRGSLQEVCQSTSNFTVIVLRVGVHALDNTVPYACENSRTNIHVIHVLPDRQDTRIRRSYSNLDIYHMIAAASGGTVYETTKGNIAAVVDIIKDSVTSSAPVIVSKFKWTTKANNSINIPVDDQIQNLTIKIQSSSLPSVTLYRPNGKEEDLHDPKVGLRKTLGANLIIIKLYSPVSGLWKIQRSSRSECQVEATGKSRLDFTYYFMQPGPGGFGEYPLVGRPIEGSNTSVQVSVPLVTTVQQVDKIVLLSDEGIALTTATLHTVGGRHGKTLFKTFVAMPTKPFQTALEGRDKKGNLFRRVDPKLVSALAIKLEVLPVSGTLYVSGSITIPYKVTNVGGGTTAIEVKILDDLHFANAPTTASFSLASGKNATGKFSLSAGASTKGQTTTVTISANPVGATSNKVQYNVQRITVEEKIKKVEDKIPPTCNVTKTTGTCNVGPDLCSCSNLTWSMSAEIGDVGFGLLTVFSSNAGNRSTFTKDKFKAGHQISNGIIHANLSADCCHQHAQISVADVAGNVAACDVIINSGFRAPDPRLCKINSIPSSSKTGNVSKDSILSCTTSDVKGSCDFRNESCSASCTNEDLCKKHNWKYVAEIGNTSIGDIKAVLVGMNNHSIRVANRTVTYSTSCCNPNVVIRVIDFAGKLGQCTGSIAVNGVQPQTTDSVSSTSLPVAMIAGASAGGVVVVIVATASVVLLKKRVCTNRVMPPKA